MVRLKPTCSHIVACYEGEGRALINGQEQPWRAGQVLLAPARCFHAFETTSAKPWKIAWVFYNDEKGAPVVPGNEARLITAEVGAFVSIVQVITREAVWAAQPAALTNLVALVDIYARRLAGAHQGDERLWKLWEVVESDLAYPWTCAALAKRASMSDEHLRRLCHRYHQRSPMDYVVHLRMQRAGMLLRTSTYKLDRIADLVGFASVYSFSAAFKRRNAVSPSEFRRTDAVLG